MRMAPLLGLLVAPLVTAGARLLTSVVERIPTPDPAVRLRRMELRHELQMERLRLKHERWQADRARARSAGEP